MSQLPSHPLHVALIGPSRFGIGEPFAGGLEAHTAAVVRMLHSRGHRVTVFAGPEGEMQQLPVRVTPIVSRRFDDEFTGRRDTSQPAGYSRHEADRYRSTLERVRLLPDVDLIHNNSLHPAVVDADPGDGSFVHVVHCPPFPELEAAHARLSKRASRRRVVAVSMAMARRWAGVATEVIHNGVDVEAWTPAGVPERRGAVWAGRLVEEKAPHLAIRAARLAGMQIRLAGPIGDQAYFDRYVAHELGRNAQWLGPLSTSELAGLFATSQVGIVSPTWDEPFCLVAAEMLASGTPVAAFDRGGLGEFVRPEVGVLATPGDAVSLADAAQRASRIENRRCAEFARSHLSATAMMDRYETVYRAVAAIRRRAVDVGTAGLATA